MSASVPQNRGRSSAHEYRVWDPLVRLIHWSVAIAVLINSLDDAESGLHELIGYTALGLVAIRLVWGLVGSHTARFSAFPPNPSAAYHHVRSILRGKTTVHLSHNPLGALMVYNIWATMVVLGVTGYMMGTMTFFGVGWVEEVHEIAYGWLITSVVLHVAGVLFDTWLTKVPLAKAMVTGRKIIPDTTATTR